jgi:2'-5' RNA ligase
VRLRLFAALELPPEAVAELTAFQAHADPEIWRPLPPASLHVTLAFLGATDELLLPDVVAALRGVDGEPAPRLALAGALLLPPRRAQVLCAALEDPDGTLAALQSRVASALAATGAYAPEARPFRPHVTVGRLRPRARSPREFAFAPEPLEFAGSAVTLFSSHTSPQGARYEALERIPLPSGRIDD